MTAWKTDISGRTVPTKTHLVDCPDCGGAGYFTDRHPHDPSAKDIKCERCDEDGRTRCADDGCCDFDPPEDD